MLRGLAVAGAIAFSVTILGGAVATTQADARALAGKTSQGYRIKVAVKGNAMKLLRFDIRLRCNDRSRLILAESGFLWTKLRKGRKFRDAQFGKTDNVYFRGRARGRSVRGRIRVFDKPKRGVRCKSPWVRFKAAKRAGKQGGKR